VADNNDSGNPPAPKPAGPALGRRAFIPEDEAITYIALVVTGGDRHKAETKYLIKARSGALPVRGRNSMSDLARQEIPREEWQQCLHQAVSDPLCGVFHFPGKTTWSDREARQADLERLWPPVPSMQKSATTNEVQMRESATVNEILIANLVLLLTRDQALRRQIEITGTIAGRAILEQEFGKAVRRLCGVPNATPPHDRPPRGWGNKHLARLARQIVRSGP
jgi:hypothetical protein